MLYTETKLNQTPYSSQQQKNKDSCDNKSWQHMKTLAIVSTILTLVFASLYFVEIKRTEQLRKVVEQRSRAFVTLNSVANGLVKLSNIKADTLMAEISPSTQLLSKSSTSYIIGTTLENPERYVWDFDVIEIIRDSTGQLQTVELFKQ
jgi:hypothetical protein